MDPGFPHFLVALLAVAASVGLAARRGSAAWAEPPLLMGLLAAAWVLPAPWGRGTVLAIAGAWFAVAAMVIATPRLAVAIGRIFPSRGTPAVSSRPRPDLVEVALDLPPGRFDLARAALAVAAETDRDLNAAEVLAVVDRMVSRLARRIATLPPSADPYDRVRAVATFLFALEGFEAIPGDPRRRDLDGLLLNRVVSRRQGHCLGLTTLFLAVTERLGLPFHGVGVPGHVFVRFDDGRVRVNVETTRGGEGLPDGWYRARYRVGEREEAAGVWLANLSAREVLVEVLHNRAAALFRTGRVAEAHQDLERATRASVNFVAAHGSMGALSLFTGDVSRAVAACRRAVRIDRRHAAGHARLGEAWLRLGRPARAAVSFRRAARLDARSAAALTGLGRAWSRLGRNDRAVECHRQALAADPACAEAWNNLGVGLSARGSADEAVAAFREAIKQDPRLAVARDNLARAIAGT